MLLSCSACVDHWAVCGTLPEAWGQGCGGFMSEGCHDMPITRVPGAKWHLGPL